jgi:hypothetical protein
MTKKRCIAVFIIVGAMCVATAQESPETTISPSGTTAPAPARSIRISFVPPPLEGTISLGIYDTAGKLVRVLHQDAPLEVFIIGADALITKWDGKDDDGQDLPAGKYHARGYLVGSLQVEKLTTDPTSSLSTGNEKITIKLMPNPLVKNDRPNVELTVGFDDTDSFVKTSDDLPLHIISERSDITRISAAKSGEKSVDVWQESGAGTEHFRMSKLDQMMAFDCGSFDLK